LPWRTFLEPASARVRGLDLAGKIHAGSADFPVIDFFEHFSASGI
jgi:hypothetical protein